MTTPEEQNPTENLTENLGEAVAAAVEGIEEAVEVVAESLGIVEEPEAARPAPIVFDRPIQTVGRRKEAVARVRLMPGTGVFTLNGRTMDDYFPNKVHQQLIKAPLVLVDRAEQFDVHVRLHGGGPSGQAGALRLAVARALLEVSAEERAPLKAAGFLTRDARAVERKKYGLKKARKASQYSKR